jgi:RNA polymerase sigma-70 factor (ECF subfamily)
MGQADDDLMRRWQGGDPAAFEALVRRWQGPVARFLARLTGPAGAVPDLGQEVFLRLYLAGGRYRAEGAFPTWLYRIALNVARDAARRRPPPQPLPEPGPADPAASAEDRCAAREEAELVARALAGLPGPLREVLVLRHYEAMNFEQMARLLGTPASTLKSRFAVALRRLRAALRAHGWEPQEFAP